MRIIRLIAHSLFGELIAVSIFIPSSKFVRGSLTTTVIMSRSIATVESPVTFRSTGNYKELIVEYCDRVCVVRINRPARRNALSCIGHNELIDALDDTKHNPQVTIVVLTGVGEFFCAGVDPTQTQNYANLNDFHKSANLVLRRLIKAIIYYPKVLVALVNGPCLGVGTTLSSLCDVVYCTESAYFVTPFTRVGLCPEFCSTYTFPLIMGRSKAAEMLLFGERLSAETALKFNFVADVFKYDELDFAFWPRIKQYSELPQEPMTITKRLMRDSERESLLQALDAECTALGPLRLGEVYQRTVEAFLKRGEKSKCK